MEWLSDLFGSGLAVALGGIGGGLMRLLPEAVKLVREIVIGKADRAHELAMRQLDRDIAKDGGEMRVRELEQTRITAETIERWKALQVATEAQGKLTGVLWADAWNIAMRPGLTTWFALWWGVSLVFPGQVFWGPANDMMFMGVVNFWFVGQVLDRGTYPTR